MQELDPDKADAVRRAYLEGETYQELATRYDVPLNSIWTWLRRSLIKFRECLSR
jgi:RNA polymerase sigma-70 factor (ECF subfamily)